MFNRRNGSSYPSTTTSLSSCRAERAAAVGTHGHDVDSERRKGTLDGRHDPAILRDKELSNSAYSHVINAPIEKVNIADWLFKLPEAEYLRCCPPDHISCGTTSTDDGKPMSINVEMIGKTLMIQHYVAEVATAALCRTVSVSDAFTPNGHTACR